MARTLGLLKDVIVLDDAFSALDERTKSRITSNIMRPTFGGKFGEYLTQAIILYATHDGTETTLGPNPMSHNSE